MGKIKPLKIVITGARGLIGWHAWSRLYAANCAAAYCGDTQPYLIDALDHKSFIDPSRLEIAVYDADAILHFAGVNRAPDEEVEAANPEIAQTLIAACQAAGSKPHIVYANSTHAKSDTPYGRSKRKASELLGKFTPQFTNLILPHIFGEGARPFYNNVTATLIFQILNNADVMVNPEGKVQLLHAGAAAQSAIDAVLSKHIGDIEPQAHDMSVVALHKKLQKFHSDYEANLYPDLTNFFDLQLFNSYRTASYPDSWSRTLKLHIDERGMLFEAVKGGGGGQTFLSTTEPGITRGDHFHINKVERFLVVQGQAVIRIRKLFSDDVWTYRVNGKEPAPVDMPTLHTHSIENVGEEPLLTLFWAHDVFDPENPDTYAEKVLS